MVTPRQIMLVQESFAAVVPVTGTVAEEFFRRLFALVPDTRALFSHDMAEQGRKLFLTLAAVVDGLDRLDEVVPMARALAVRHVAYGALPRHYDAVGAALIETLGVALGQAFDADTEGAWAAAYQLLAGVMLDAARAAA